MKTLTFKVRPYGRTLKLTDVQLRRRNQLGRAGLESMKLTAVRWARNRAERAGLVVNLYDNWVEVERDASCCRWLIHAVVSTFEGVTDPEMISLLQTTKPPPGSMYHSVRFDVADVVTAASGSG